MPEPLRVRGDASPIKRYVLGYCGIEGDIRGTAWAALQAVSEYADHHRSTRTVEGTSMETRRLESIWMGKTEAPCGAKED